MYMLGGKLVERSRCRTVDRTHVMIRACCTFDKFDWELAGVVVDFCFASVLCYVSVAQISTELRRFV